MSKRNLLFSAALPLMSLAFASAAFAQQAAPIATTPVADVESEDTGEEIVVTGTRITNPNLVSATKILSIGGQEIQDRQAIAVEELLRQLPGIVPSVGPGVNNGNGGAQTINLRGLGTNRNLVLIDNRRIVPFGLGGVVDTNLLPLGLIERADIVTGGASSTYGADAITGVVNFVTRKNFEGVDAQNSVRISQQGDGLTYRSDLTLGANFSEGKGNVTLGIAYQNQNPVLQGDRDIGAVGFSSGVLNRTGIPSQQGSGTAVPVNISTGSGPNTIPFVAINPATGVIGTTTSDFNFNPLNLFQTPVERFNIFAQGHYELTPKVEFFTQAFFTRSSVRSQLAPTGTFTNTYQLPLSNAFLPVAARNQICLANNISQAACDLAGAALTTANPNYREVPAILARRFVEQGPRFNQFNTNVFQIQAGLRGDLSPTWSWEISGEYGESNLVNTSGGGASFSRAQQALRATNPNTCLSTANGCVPLNLFGAEGSITQAQLGFIGVQTSVTTNTQFVQAIANLNGDLGAFKSPFSKTPIGLSTGLEFRQFGANTAGDFLSQQAGEVLGAGGAAPIVVGGTNVIEGYVETIAPLIEDVFLIKKLTIEAGTRVSSYNSTGLSTTWKAGSTWAITDNYRLRGVFQRAVRSPNIAELFSPVQTVLNNLAADPCAGAISPAVAALCIAQGAPAGSIGQIINPIAGQLNVTTGGNPDVDVERASTVTVGLQASPGFIPNLSFSLDYFNISVRDAITAPAVGDIISGCFSTTLNPSLAFNASCALISRNSLNGSLNGSPADTRGVILAQSNLGRINTTGLDWSVSYNHGLGGLGNLAWFINGTYTFENRFQATPASVDRECIGFYSNNCDNLQPQLQFNQRATWSINRFDVSIQHRFISAVFVEPLANPVRLTGALAGTPTFQPAFSNINARNYFDLTLRARIFSGLDASLVIDNLINTDPPFVGSTIGSTAFNTGNTYPTVYDTIGRRFTMALRARF